MVKRLVQVAVHIRERLVLPLRCQSIHIAAQFHHLLFQALAILSKCCDKCFGLLLLKRRQRFLIIHRLSDHVNIN